MLEWCWESRLSKFGVVQAFASAVAHSLNAQQSQRGRLSVQRTPSFFHTLLQVATWHKMFSREVRLREAMKRIIAVMWSHDVAPAATGYTANDIIIGVESGEVEGRREVE
jgi:hypothetical protein